MAKSHTKQMENNMPLIAKFARKLTLLSFFGLFFTIAYGIVILDIYKIHPRLYLILLLLGPMMFAVRGLLHGKRYTHAWCSFLSLFYILLGIDLWQSFKDIPFASSCILLTVLWFTGCVLYSRYCGLPWKR
jgi:uncharacterized membrane protein